MRLQNAYDAYKRLRPGGSVSSLRQAITAWRARMAATTGNEEYAAPMVEDATPVQAFVNAGRWIVLCACNNGIITPPPTEPGAQAICPACGTVWTNVIFPGEAPAIVQALEERRFPPNQNWVPGETAADLRRQNDEHAKGKR